MSNGPTEIWLRMYEEQMRHARHHEEMRSQSTNFILAISAALLAFIASEVATPDLRSALGLFLVVVNIYGLVMSLKHYERSRLHVAVGGDYRDVISDASSFGGTRVNDVRAAAKAAHAASYRFLRPVRAYLLWSGLHIVLAALGAAVVWLQ